MHYKTVDRFFPRARELRSVFDRRFANPLEAHRDRFVWDYWHVPGEYTHLRTPAYTYFPKSLYERFHRHLVNWGREHLGCHDVSPPWLSSYVEGCRQEPHRDVPHGPLAFVFSLTTGTKFRGGETFIQKPRTLIQPKFNRLTLFNPALTHGVREVRGTHDPREGRLVIHGWFVNPRPFWVGPLSVPDVQQILDRELSTIEFAEGTHGFASFRLRVNADGTVCACRALVDTLSSNKVAARLANRLLGLRFPRRPKGSTLTLPLRIN
ncbi:MAG TPA: 2OG-Fe(II) oxygenase [Bdellovibrionales bacterium]|nr:2OG-Fe(II) oxygenase [Bdellovibrionales bacterium]